MKLLPLLHRVYRDRQLFWPLVALLVVFVFWSCRHFLYTAWTLASLPIIWSRGSSQFLISAEADAFDVTFSNYSLAQNTAGPLYDDLVPPVLHHISLGHAPIRPKWREAMEACLDWHPGWESHVWTDENARDFVAESFPELLATWDGYRYPVQRVDALRYMVLYHYGGVVLDMDLKCKRSLGPLRRFSFVAPAAHPTGFSIGFMMASKGNDFVLNIVRSLQAYNRQWLLLPYPTVMFSTGCHFASTIHAIRPNRSDLKILGGTENYPKLHMLNGPVSTPIFDHLGSSSWHSYDASLIVKFGRIFRYGHRLFFIIGFLCATWFVLRKLRSRGFGGWRFGKYEKSVEDRFDWA